MNVYQKNWSFGKRDDFSKKRLTFVPWELVAQTKLITPLNDYELTDNRIYDRQMLPKIIMDQHERGEEDIRIKGLSERRMYAYVKNDKKKQSI